MRAMMTAGPALERDHMAGYNCSFIVVDHPRAFDECLYILTCGTGVGFSCEQHEVAKLPEVPEELHATDSTIVVADSRIGWASAYRELIHLLYAGKIPRFDVSRVRAKGERLRTFGGRASGPDPLVDLFNHTIGVFTGAAGRKLSDIEVHGIMCKIGQVVVVGGVRRSALISLSSLGSHAMRDAKAGDWGKSSPHYALANNSAVYDEPPTMATFMPEWYALYRSKSGERGIYNRKGMRDKTAAIGKRDPSQIKGTNPCAEIALRNAGLCNLSEIVVRPHDTPQTLERKAYLAAVIGTVQATFTNFRYVRPIWKRNAEEERLLGVSMTGIYDNPLTYTLGDELEALLEHLKDTVNRANAEWSIKLGINPAAASTCVKPSGTVGQLVHSGNGIHPRHSRYYIRAVRQDNKDPVTQLLKAHGVPHEPDIMAEDSVTVFYFPMEVPEGAPTRDDVDALSHLELWRTYNKHWAEHQVSITVSIEEDQWMEVGAWVYKHFDEITGVSFLPMNKGTYKQAPYDECSREVYEKALAAMPEIDWGMLSLFESDDRTTSSQELACVGGACEVL